MREHELRAQIELLRVRLHDLHDATEAATRRTQVMEESLEALKASLGDLRRVDPPSLVAAADSAALPEPKAA